MNPKHINMPIESPKLRIYIILCYFLDFHDPIPTPIKQASTHITTKNNLYVHNIIQIHNNVQREWQYSANYSNIYGKCEEYFVKYD